MNLEELRRRRAAARDANRALIEAARAAGRDLSDEERSQFDARMAEIRSLSADIDRAKAFEADERAAGRPQREPTLPNPATPPPGETQRFASFGEQLRAVAVAAVSDGRQVDRRLIEERAPSGANEGVPTDGGFLVQSDFSTELLRRSYATGQVISRARRIPISSGANSLKINGINETSRANGSRWGGVQSYWAAEADTATASRPKFRQVELNLNKLLGFFYTTDELLADAAALEEIGMLAFSDEFGFKLDDAAVRGPGAGTPLGILNSPSLVTVAKEGGQAAATIVYENLVKMWSRMWAASRPNAVWFINQDIEPQLFTMGLIVGTGGAPVYLPPGGLSATPYGTLFGRPVVPIEQCSTLGTVGDIILADMSQYVAAEKGGMQSAASIHVRFLYDESCFRFTMRVDGQPLWNSALTPANGSNTLSPFVALATRS